MKNNQEKKILDFMYYVSRLYKLGNLRLKSAVLPRSSSCLVEKLKSESLFNCSFPHDEANSFCGFGNGSASTGRDA